MDGYEVGKQLEQLFNRVPRVPVVMGHGERTRTDKLRQISRQDSE